MKATNIGKTIIVWDKLSDEEIIRFLKAVEISINNYRDNATDNINGRAVAIRTNEHNKFFCIMKKNNEVVMCATRNKNGDFNFMPILNADDLYSSVVLLEKSALMIKAHIQILEKFPETNWIKLPFARALEDYCLSPNINPPNFIKNLEAGTLSELSKQFLQDAGFALEHQNHSAELQSVIIEANRLFEDREM